MPLFATLAIIAILGALVLMSRRDAGRSVWRVFATAAGMWIALVVLAVALLTVGTLIFGR